MSEKIFITWEEFHKDTIKLAEKIKQSGTYDKIVAVSRGGLIPAGILAYELNIRNSEAINISSYDGEKQRSLRDVEISALAGDVNNRTLIVDDLSDSGNTFRLLRTRFPKARYVAVYAKPAGRREVDIYIRDMPDEWLIFPWD